MIIQNLVEALGAMTLSYFISAASHSLVNKLSSSGKHKVLCYLLTFIYFVSSMLSLFVGLFMYHFHDRISTLQHTIDDLTTCKNDLSEKVSTLEEENAALKRELRQEVFRTDKRILDQGYRNGYYNGYAVGFEDCMDITGLPQERKESLMRMARTSGLHRIKTRPNMLDEQKAVEKDGILR